VGEDFPAVPGEVGGVGAEGGLGGEGEPAAVEVGELEVRPAGEDGFGDVGLGDADAQGVVDGPEAGVEEVAVATRSDPFKGAKLAVPPSQEGCPCDA
jgi:hypothetical protein